MFLEILAFFVLLLILSILYINKSDENSLPGPLKLPVLGNAHILLLGGRRSPPYESLMKVNKRYGKLVEIKFGILNIISTCDYEIIKEILCGETWIERPASTFISERSFGKPIGILFGNGQSHLELRRFSLRTLRDFGFGVKNSMEGCIDDELKYLIARLNKKLDAGENTMILSRFFTVSVLNNIWSMIAGIRFSHDNEKLQKMITTLYDLSKSFPIGRNVAVAFPFLIPLLNVLDSKNKMRKEFYKFTHSYFREILDERRAEGYYKEDQRDYIDVFLKEIDNTKNDPNSQFTDESFIVTCFDLFAAGAETSSNTLEFCILYCILNPNVQKKVQEEIDRVIGQRTPTLQDKPNMKFTDCTILETQRLGNVLPVTIRVNNSDTKVGKYNIPKGTIANLNLYGMHMDEEIWDNPIIFNPERFLDSNGNIINSHKILPFGMGKRVCMGEQLAKATLFIYFTSLLQKYSFSIAEDHPRPDIKPVTGFTLSPAPFYVTIKHR